MKELVTVIVDGGHLPKISVNIVERSFEVIGGQALMPNDREVSKPDEVLSEAGDVDPVSGEVETAEGEQYAELETFIAKLEDIKDPAQVEERERMRRSLKQALEQDLVTAERKVKAATSDLNGAPAHLKKVYDDRLKKAVARREDAKRELERARGQFDF